MATCFAASKSAVTCSAWEKVSRRKRFLDRAPRPWISRDVPCKALCGYARTRRKGKISSRGSNSRRGTWAKFRPRNATPARCRAGTRKLVSLHDGKVRNAGSRLAVTLLHQRKIFAAGQAIKPYCRPPAHWPSSPTRRTMGKRLRVPESLARGGIEAPTRGFSARRPKPAKSLRQTEFYHRQHGIFRAVRARLAPDFRRYAEIIFHAPERRRHVERSAFSAHCSM